MSVPDPRAKVIAIVESFPEGIARPVLDYFRLEVRGKLFGWYMESHHGDGRLAINCKALPGVAQSMVDANSVVYHIPKYVGKKGWAGIWVDVPGLDWEEIATLLYDAYAMTAPKALLKL